MIDCLHYNSNMPAQFDCRSELGRSQASGSQGERGCNRASFKLLTSITARQGRSRGNPRVQTTNGGHLGGGDRTRSRTPSRRSPSQGGEDEAASDDEDAEPKNRSRRSTLPSYHSGTSSTNPTRRMPSVLPTHASCLITVLTRPLAFTEYLQRQSRR